MEAVWALIEMVAPIVFCGCCGITGRKSRRDANATGEGRFVSFVGYYWGWRNVGTLSEIGFGRGGGGGLREFAVGVPAPGVCLVLGGADVLYAGYTVGERHHWLAGLYLGAPLA